MRKAELNRWHIFYTYTENGVEKMKNSLVWETVEQVKKNIRLWESIEMAFVNGRATTTTKYTFIHWTTIQFYFVCTTYPTTYLLIKDICLNLVWMLRGCHRQQFLRNRVYIRICNNTKMKLLSSFEYIVQFNEEKISRNGNSWTECKLNWNEVKEGVATAREKKENE